MIVMSALCLRMGRNMKLTVRTADEPDSEATGTIDGEHIVLDLDPAYTRFYVGGVPNSAQVRSLIMLVSAVLNSPPFWLL